MIRPPAAGVFLALALAVIGPWSPPCLSASPVVAQTAPADGRAVCEVVSKARRGAHGLAMRGAVNYRPDFTHFGYVAPNAPKGGTMRRSAIGSFDTLNPFIVKGQAAAGLGLAYDTLMTAAADEAFSTYGLVAESVATPEDRNWVVFTLRPEARFHDGRAVGAEDVVFTFKTLTAKGSPAYRFHYADVQSVKACDSRTVAFLFKKPNRELPLTLGQLPVLPKHYWEGKDFEATTLTPPLGGGPYAIARFEPGRYIEYRRDPDYWAKDLPVMRGRYNFDVIRYDYYRDFTVRREAFKARAFDLIVENSSRSWARDYDFPAARDGRVKKKVFLNAMPTGMQGYVYNLRRALFRDPRVREALAYAYDFEWVNDTLAAGDLIRTQSYFDNSELRARGTPSPGELAVLNPWRDRLPPRVFTQEYNAPSSHRAGGLRANLIDAFKLLTQAGWVVRDNRLVHSQTGQPFEFEILLPSPAMERSALPFAKNLERLGIVARVRTVDSAQYINRVTSYDFDMIVDLWPQSLSPGNELRDFWGSAAAGHPGSRNSMGLKSPVVDDLIEHVVNAKTREQLVLAVRALDRVMRWSFLVIPQFYFPGERIAWWDAFAMPAVVPARGVQLDAWWAKDAGPATAMRGGR